MTQPPFHQLASRRKKSLAGLEVAGEVPLEVVPCFWGI